ncbi:MAG: hypothetical protein AB7O24_19280 [Kofleriaceae bacterium]
MQNPSATAGPPSKTKLAVIFGAVALTLAGGSGYLLGVHQPARRLRAAQAEITSWENRWDRARECMLGSKPASGTISEALAIREMSPDRWERTTCTKLIGAINRGDAEDTGLASVEAAWLDLDKAALALAKAFATHVDPDGELDRRAEDPLPGTLDALEAGRNALRSAAGLSPRTAATIPPLPAATMIAVMHDGKPVVSIEAPRVTSRDGMVVVGSAASGPVQLHLVAGRPPIVGAIEPATRRAVPDPSWGARSVHGAIEIGTVDAGGEVTTPKLIKVTGRSVVLAASGSLDDGAVVYLVEDGLAIARVTGGKVTTSKPVYAASHTVAVDPASGEIAIVWTDAALELVALRLAPGTLDEKPVRIGDTGVALAACLDRRSLWIQDPAVLYRFDDSGLRTIEPRRSYELAGCSSAGAVVTRPVRPGQPPLHQVCSDRCVDIVTDRGFAPVALPNDNWVAFDARGNVLAVKRPDGTQFVTTTEQFRPLYAMTDGSQIDVVGYTTRGIAVARVPAPR